MFREVAADGEQARAITCVIGDDHPAILKSIGAYLGDEGFEVVGLAATGSEVLRLLEQRRPDVALVDQCLPDIDGIEIVARARQTAPDTQILLYTGLIDEALAREVLDAGGRGIVLKEAPLPDVVRALTVAAAGSTYIDPRLGGALAVSREVTPALTQREREVLRDLAAGMSNGEIGAKLCLSPETVRTHVRKAMARTGARTRTQAVAAALREGMIS